MRDRYTGDDQVRIDLEHLEGLLVRLPVLAGRLQIGVQIHPRPDLERVFGDRAFGARDGGVDVALQEQEAAVQRPCQRIAGLARTWMVEVALGGLPIHVVLRGEAAEQRVRFREGGVERERPLSGPPRLCDRIMW